MKVLSSIYWSAGAEKECNQDTITLQQVITPKGRAVLALVCDGMGGLSQGEIAGGYIAEQIINWFYRTGTSMIEKGKGRRKIKRSLLRVFFEIQEELGKYGKRKGIHMGSTVTMLLLWKNRYQVIHLGDSRIYLWGRRMRQLTHDHCNGDRVLTKCMGSFSWQKPDFRQGKIRRNSGFLLCTDGFRNKVSFRQIEEAFRPREISEERQIEARLREMGEYAMKKGEKDNISAIYIKIV